MILLRRFLPVLAALVYIVSPLDPIPDVLAGIGWIDDLIVLGMLLWYLSVLRQGGPAWGSGRGRPRSGRVEGDGGAGQGADSSDPYVILGVDRGATAKEIRAAYRRTAAQYHPDKVAHLGRELQDVAHRKMLEIQRAYEVLTGVTRRSRRSNG